LRIDCTSRIIPELFATLSRYSHCAFMQCDRLYVEDNSRTPRHPLTLLPLCIYVLRYDCTSRIIPELFATISRYCHCAFMQCDRLRSAEHTSELQSRFDLVCRLLLENKIICS